MDDTGAFFWMSGADGRLRFLRCSECSYFIHPPAPYCPRCGGLRAAPEPVAGRGKLYSYTVNHQPWDGTDEPYIIGVVTIEEQPDLRLLTNLVDVTTDDVRIGMAVEVVFEDHTPVHIPLFRPTAP
ncbi:Zn-ribbon domain-containing OB-fold protein [Mycobacterium intracellulare]|uniref:Zn-ribbon domain-containing OB-fold protein n=1 Tax=Mycobacterium intracellulare TaxID=1767 RepID=UPI001F0BE236|nr:OB-fold domain-containing protein [Mycobacterium intracellulare]